MKNRICAYCHEEKKLTKEHIWPKCIINRMPELDLKFLDNKKIITSSELIISDVCSDCNNVILSPLDSYFCSLYDKYFKDYHEEKNSFYFEYDYDQLLRSFLKITYNSSRTVTREKNDFEKFRDYIRFGNEVREDIVIKLDIVTPSLINGIKVYPNSARCGRVKIDVKSDHFILRMIAVNSFYFFIVISKDERISDEAVENEFGNVINNIPGTIVHPYRDKILVNQFSSENTFSVHQSHINENSKHYDKFLNKKNSR